MPEAPLEDSGSGLAPAGDGWFVVNVRDAQWLSAENSEGKPPGSDCRFESREFYFPQLAIKVRVLEPGQPNGMYHSENQQEAFLVLSGECRLLVEGEETRCVAAANSAAECAAKSPRSWRRRESTLWKSAAATCQNDAW